MNSNAKVLYVDDEEINLFLFKINFSKKYQVLTAYNGIEGLDVLNNNSDIKVVISDMKMPKMDGLTFIKEARKKFYDINYFILTGFEITDEIQNALDQQIILQYFRKPFDLKEVYSAISRYI